MLRHKSTYLLLAAAFLICGCSRSFAPDGWLPETEVYTTNLYGGWMTLLVISDSIPEKKEAYEYKGEFLAVDSLNVYLLADSAYTVKKDEVKDALLELDEKNSGKYALWGAAFLLTPVVNGIISIITAPIGIISGFGAASIESGRDRYQVSYPDERYWNEVSKFSRFPQGIPEGIELNRVRPKALTISD